MLQFLRRLIRPDERFDPNTLTPIERSLFESFAAIHAPNVLLLCVRLQLLNWLKVGSVASLAGMPSWFSRSRAAGAFVLEPKRIVGGEFSLPADAGRQLINGTADYGSQQIEVGFEVLETFQKIIFDPWPVPSGFEPPEEVKTSFMKVPDDRPFWERTGEQFPEFVSISEALLEFLDQPSHNRRQRVVLPVPSRQTVSQLDGVDLPESYSRLLSYSNGLRINNLMIWGTKSVGRRICEIKSTRYLYLGCDAGSMLVLKVEASAASDVVYRLPVHGRPVTTGHNVHSLCEHHLSRTHRE